MNTNDFLRKENNNQQKLMLSSIIKEYGLNPKDVKIVRHSYNKTDVRVCFKRDLIKEYQAIQKNRVFHNKTYILSFIGEETGTTAKFLGLYKVIEELQGHHQSKMSEGYPYPEQYEKDEFYYKLEKLNEMKPLEGKLIIQWGRSTKCWAQNGTTDKEVLNCPTLSSNEESVSKEKIRSEYWKYAVDEIRKAVPELYGNASIIPDRSAFDSIRKNNTLLTCIANIRTNVISVGIYFRKPNSPDKNKAKADLILKKKEQIRELLSFPEVKIAPAEGREPYGPRNDYNVLFSIHLDVLDRNNWKNCCDFHSKTAKDIYTNIFLKLIEIDENDSKLKTIPECYESETGCSSHLPLSDFYSLRNEAFEVDSTSPEIEKVSVNRYRRSNAVVDYTKRRAKGVCQLCEKKAPFFDLQGIPFLEVHHVIPLSEGGADKPYNTVALCPNCHRKMHKLKNSSDINKLKRIAEQDIIF